MGDLAVTRPQPPGPPGACHGHDWPLTAAAWNRLASCGTCGLRLLSTFVRSADWVVRRVEKIEFVDDRTVRRRVSVDYTMPDSAVVLRTVDGREIRILPVALMRRKNMIQFDFRDHEGLPMPLLGLRENQALTLAVVRAWAHTTLQGPAPTHWAAFESDLDKLLDDLVAGDQAELSAAYMALEDRYGDSVDESEKLRFQCLMAVVERLAGHFVLFAMDGSNPGTRRIVKWSYDEPLTLLYSTTHYQGYPGGPLHSTGHDRPRYGRTGVDLRWWRRAPMLAGLGLQPTLIRFPTAGAELAASFHVEITAPPEVSIVRADLLADTPNLRFDESGPEADRRKCQEERDRPRPRPWRLRRRPSYDSVGGGYPTVDLHVADVPWGSLSRAQVELQASPAGWLAAAWVVTLIATVTLFAAFFANPTENAAVELPTAVLLAFAAAMVAVVWRPDPHVMVTRLLGRLRILAAISAILVLAAGGAFALFDDPADAHWVILGLAIASLVPSLTLTVVWGAARRRLLRDRPPGRREARRRRDEYERAVEPWDRTSPADKRALLRERRTARVIRLSPWEQHQPGLQPFGDYVDADVHERIADFLETADYPYDEAVFQLGFDLPAIKVASLEGDRSSFPWTVDFEHGFLALLDAAIADGRADTATDGRSRDGDD